MATPLRCPNCYDNLGKDKENPINAYCGTCGTHFKNPRGYDPDKEIDDEEPEIIPWWKGGGGREWSDH